MKLFFSTTKAIVLGVSVIAVLLISQAWFSRAIGKYGRRSARVPTECQLCLRENGPQLTISTINDRTKEHSSFAMLRFVSTRIRSRNGDGRKKKLSVPFVSVWLVITLTLKIYIFTTAVDKPPFLND